MAVKAMRGLTLVAGLAWLVVAGDGMRSVFADSDDWELSYMVFSLALLVGAMLVVALVAQLTRDGSRPLLRMVGLVVCSLGVLSSIVAWASPLWMTILGVGLALLAIASGPGGRRVVAFLAAGQLVGLAVLYTAHAAEVGRQDGYGDHPAASGIAVVVTAGLTIMALFKLRNSLEPEVAGSSSMP